MDKNSRLCQTVICRNSTLNEGSRVDCLSYLKRMSESRVCIGTTFPAHLSFEAEQSRVQKLYQLRGNVLEDKNGW
jgi:hypothetical protein